MKVICYFINYNDSFYLPFLAKHYGKFCSEIIMYDNYSSDNSVELAKSLGFEVRLFGVPGELNDQHYLNVKNHCWKEQRGRSVDYVIVCDADEFICMDGVSSNVPEVIGYNMISDSLPVTDITEINTGAYSESYSKQAIFNPDALKEINFVHGCHRNILVEVDPSVLAYRDKCRLLHYRQIGGIDRMLIRHAAYRERMSKFNLQHGMGIHYLTDDENKRNEWNILKSESTALW